MKEMGKGRRKDLEWMKCQHDKCATSVSLFKTTFFGRYEKGEICQRSYVIPLYE